MDLFKFRKKALNKILAYKRHFKLEDGELILNDLLSRFHFKTSTMCKDPYDTAYNEGQRSVVLYILSQLEKSEKEILDLLASMKDAKEDE